MGLYIVLLLVVGVHKAVFKSSFRFTYVLFVVMYTMYHVNKICRVAVEMIMNGFYFPTGGPHKQCVCLCSKYKEMYGRILKSLNIVNLYRGMSKLKLKINVKVPQLLCIVVSVALNGEFERFGGFCVNCSSC